MIYQHIKKKTVYTEVLPHKSKHYRDHGYVYARTQETGRLVTVREDNLRAVETEADLEQRAQDLIDEAAWLHREKMQELAWQLSRELPYNLGVAVTNIAMYQHGGSLQVAVGAARDEIVRMAQPETQQPVEETHE